MNESLKTWIKIGLSVLTFLVAIGIWIGKMDSDIKDLQKSAGITSSIDLEDIEASLELPNYKIEQNFQAIRELQKAQQEIQKQNAMQTGILEVLQRKVMNSN